VPVTTDDNWRQPLHKRQGRSGAISALCKNRLRGSNPLAQVAQAVGRDFKESKGKDDAYPGDFADRV
jgi:hypothetical protein